MDHPTQHFDPDDNIDKVPEIAVPRKQWAVPFITVGVLGCLEILN